MPHLASNSGQQPLARSLRGSAVVVGVGLGVRDRLSGGRNVIEQGGALALVSLQAHGRLLGLRGGTDRPRPLEGFGKALGRRREITVDRFHVGGVGQIVHQRPFGWPALEVVLRLPRDPRLGSRTSTHSFGAGGLAWPLRRRFPYRPPSRSRRDGLLPRREGGARTRPFRRGDGRRPTGGTGAVSEDRRPLGSGLRSLP